MYSDSSIRFRALKQGNALKQPANTSKELAISGDTLEGQSQNLDHRVDTHARVLKELFQKGLQLGRLANMRLEAILALDKVISKVLERLGILKELDKQRREAGVVGPRCEFGLQGEQEVCVDLEKQNIKDVSYYEIEHHSLGTVSISSNVLKMASISSAGMMGSVSRLDRRSSSTIDW